MNNIDYLSENNFLIPYYKKFIKLLKNDKILLLESIKTNADDFFKSLGKKVLTTNSSELVDGIVLNNYLKKSGSSELLTFIKEMYNCLNDDGIVLLINNKHELDETKIDFLFEEMFDKVEELIGDDKWNFILYQKRTTK